MKAIHSRVDMEVLELRQLLSAGIRTIDGTGNNVMNPFWGSVGTPLLRMVAPAYADGISAPGGTTRPSARAISNAISAQSEDQRNDRNMSAFVYAWGQFLDHDIDLTPGASPSEPFNVAVPTGDEMFDPAGTGTQNIFLNRSKFDPTTGTSTTNPRQQVNVITTWIDGSVVYGSDTVRAAALRSFAGGKLKTSDGDMLPFNTDGLPNANDAHIFPDNQLFLAGDVRANENVELTSLQALFMREHNRIAADLAKKNPRWTDEQLYQGARKIVIAEIQAITYNEFLPALLGRGALARYRGYNPKVDPSIANEFSTAAFRFGHSMINDDVEFMDNNGVAVRDEIPLAQAFFNPQVVEESGIDPILKYLASDRTQEIDTHIVDGLRNFLFGPPGAGGLDLASLNIQRGRDHGLADYNTTRVKYGLPRVTTFAQITSDPVLQAKLQELYGSVDNIDLWVGGLAEDHVAASSTGPLVRRILVDQFQRLRDADRFWYQTQFSGRQLATLERTRLSDIISRNTDIHNLQDNVFIFDVTLSGRIFNDRDGNGRQQFRERGLSGWSVRLLDEEGNVVDMTTTTASGRYDFAGLDLGTYTIDVVAPNGWTQTSRALGDIAVTRGMNIAGKDVGFKNASATTGGEFVYQHWPWRLFDNNGITQKDPALEVSSVAA